MTPYYVLMTSEHLKILQLLYTSSCVNLVTIALTALKHIEGGEGFRSPQVPEGEVISGLCVFSSLQSTICYYLRSSRYIYITMYQQEIRGIKLKKNLN